MNNDLQPSPTRNPMNLFNLLNHGDTGYQSVSDDEEVELSPLEQDLANRLHEMNLQSFHAARPMEVDGELPMIHTTSPNHQIYLPPMRVALSSEYERTGSFQATEDHNQSAALPNQPRDETFHVRRDGRTSSQSLSPQLRAQNLSGCRRRSFPSYSSSCNGPFPSSRGITKGKDGEIRKKKKKPTGSFSNRPYTQEQVQWLRYHNEDCDLSYSEMFQLWGRQFPHPDDARGDGQNFSSRLYRDHKVPAMDKNGDPTFDENGKPKYIECKVRKRTDIDQMNIPFKLVEKHPEWALYWSWVSPADKAIARKILEGRDLDFAQTMKEKYRRAIRKLDAVLPPKKGWYSSPSHHAEALKKQWASQACSKL